MDVADETATTDLHDNGAGGDGQAAARKKTKRGKKAGRSKHERRKGGRK